MSERQTDNRRAIFGWVAAACIAVAVIWAFVAKQNSDYQRQMDGLRNDVSASAHLENISRQMEGLDPLPVETVNTDPGVPWTPIAILFLIGVASAGAAVAIRPAGPMPPSHHGG